MDPLPLSLEILVQLVLETSNFCWKKYPQFLGDFLILFVPLLV